MKKVILSLSVCSILLFSCKNDSENDIDLPVTEAPTSYAFVRNGATSVNYSGQSTRIAMGNLFVSALKDETKTESQLDAMFDHQEGSVDFGVDSLDTSSKNLRSKTAASSDLFSDNSTDAIAIKSQFDAWIAEQVSDVYPYWNNAASAGSAGKIQQAGGGSTRYVNGKGVELNQIINKGLIGGLMVDQMINNYLSSAVLDAGTNISDNDLKTLASGKNYTTMEHKWDEGFGYLYGADNAENPTLSADSFLNKYLAKVDGDPDFKGIANTIYDAFKLGRAAIVNNDYITRDEQVEIIRENISKVIAIRAIYYLQQGKADLNSDMAAAFHDLSEGLGFIYSLQFTRQPNSSDSYFTLQEVTSFIDTLMVGNGLWDVTPYTLDTMSETIAAKFDFTVQEAAN